jgi:two-component system chemotaxis response regulator CheY
MNFEVRTFGIDSRDECRLAGMKASRPRELIYQEAKKMYFQLGEPNPRVLVADDDPVIRHLVCQAVRSEGYEVVLAEDGGEALRILQHDTDFKGAIFDLMMPHIEGIDLVRHMRTEKRFMRIPVLMITSESDFQTASKTFAAGATLFLQKPFSPEQLRTTLRMLTHQRAEHNHR